MKIMQASRSVQDQKKLFKLPEEIKLPGNRGRRIIEYEGLPIKTYDDRITQEMLLNLEAPSDALLEKIANDNGCSYKRNQKGADRFYTVEGKPIYPPNDGAVGKPQKAVLLPGMIVSRYGFIRGYFFGNEKDSYAQRALPKNTNQQDYHRLMIKKAIEVDMATIAPWFNKPGGGTQYKISQYVFNHFDEYFEEI